MTPQPHTLSLHRRIVRKLPHGLRLAFVRAFNALAWRKRKPGRHHPGGVR